MTELNPSFLSVGLNVGLYGVKFGDIYRGWYFGHASTNLRIGNSESPTTAGQPFAVNRRVVSSSLTCGANLINELRVPT